MNYLLRKSSVFTFCLLKLATFVPHPPPALNDQIPEVVVVALTEAGPTETFFSVEFPLNCGIPSALDMPKVGFYPISTDGWVKSLKA